MSNSRPKVLALDLEGTLISNAKSQIPRPGLLQFLVKCREPFSRVVVFTTVEEERFRAIARMLLDEGVVPEWFASVEYTVWKGETKDLNFVPGVHWEEVLLVDDFESYVHPGQEQQWIHVEHFDYPYGENDNGLAQLLEVLQQYAGPT